MAGASMWLHGDKDKGVEGATLSEGERFLVVRARSSTSQESR